VALTWDFTGAPPGTRTPNPRIKSPLLTSSIPAVYQHLYASTLARYPQSPEAACRPLTGRYRVVPGHPSEHGANMEIERSRPMGKMITTALDEGTG
jgi:hypothetical protein